MDGVQPVFILGPCVIESEAFVRDMARRLQAIAGELKLRWVFKASYDKANRSSGSSYRGPGCKEGCKILAEIGKELGVPVTTDVHSPEEAKRAAEVDRSPSDPGVPLPADRSHRGCGRDRPGGECEERPVPRAVGREEHRRQAGGGGLFEFCFY